MLVVLWVGLPGLCLVRIVIIEREQYGLVRVVALILMLVVLLAI